MRDMRRLDGAAAMTATRVHSEASEQLTRALITLASRGERPRCGDGESSWMWLDEDPNVRRIATAMCSGCGVIAECDAVGQHQRFGVFGGIDRTRAPGRRLP
jgi:hypothetical protein